MAGITFNDGTGSVTLRGIIGAPYNRFRSLTPNRVPVGPAVSRLSTGQRTLWRYRTDFTGSLEFPHISARTYGGESGTIRAGRLMAHLLNGGTCDLLYEDDVSTPNLTGCWLTDGTTPALVLEDSRAMLYTLSLSLTHGTTPFLAIYGGLLP
jgi:hypothetical protein